MKPQTIFVMALAIVLGGSAALGIRGFLKTQGGDPVDQVKVVVPMADIARHSILSATQLQAKSFPKDMVPVGVATSIEEVIDRSALTSLAKGEPILNTRLSPKGQRGLAALIPTGMRGYTITTPSVATGVAGLLYPGNRVDVLLTVTNHTITAPNGTQIDPSGGGSTITLLQNVEVLALDQTVEMPTEPSVMAVKEKDLRSVTLLVNPEQAQKLKLGEVKGTLHLSLRNQADTADSRPRPTMLTDLRFWRDSPNNGDGLATLWQNLGKAAAIQARKAKEKEKEQELHAQHVVPLPPAPQAQKWVINTIRGGNIVGRQEVIARPVNQSQALTTQSGRSTP